MNILSIDWDYFVKCSAHDRFFLFPDSGNEKLNKDLVNFIWDVRYQSSKEMNKNIENFPIKENYDEIFDIIRNIKWNKQVLIANSHLHCYQFIKDISNKEDKVNIYNIDFHHDCYNHIESNEINCGNWLLKLVEENKVNKIVWIKQEDSDEIDKSLFLPKVEEYLNFDCLRNIQWDGIFICKSHLWSPPHLDEMFIDIFEFIKENLIAKCKYEPYALQDRWDKLKKTKF